MMRVLFYWGIILCVWNTGLWIIGKLDKPCWKLDLIEYRIWVGCSAGNALVIEALPNVDGSLKLLLAVFGGALLFACITDCKTCEIYQFTWWIGGVAGCGSLCKMLVDTRGMDFEKLGTLLFFCLLQELFFCRFYGRADCHAFVVSALSAYGLGMQLIDCLNHMLYAFVCVAVVQLFCHNINRKGNLKCPVAFLPYITVTFWINLCCFSLGKMIY